MKNNSPEIAQEALRLLNSKTGDHLQPEVDNISPIIDLTVKPLNIIRVFTLTNATASTAVTVPTDRDWYLVAVEGSFTKDATATSTLITLSVVENEFISSRNVCSFATLTLTAQSGSKHIYLGKKGLKLLRGSTIQATSTTATGNFNSIFTAYIYETNAGR